MRIYKILSRANAVLAIAIPICHLTYFIIDILFLSSDCKAGYVIDFNPMIAAFEFPVIIGLILHANIYNRIYTNKPILPRYHKYEFSAILLWVLGMCAMVFMCVIIIWRYNFQPYSIALIKLCPVTAIALFVTACVLDKKGRKIGPVMKADKQRYNTISSVCLIMTIGMPLVTLLVSLLPTYLWSANLVTFVLYQVRQLLRYWVIPVTANCISFTYIFYRLYAGKPIFPVLRKPQGGDEEP